MDLVALLFMNLETISHVPMEVSEVLESATIDHNISSRDALRHYEHFFSMKKSHSSRDIFTQASHQSQSALFVGKS